MRILVKFDFKVYIFFIICWFLRIDREVKCEIFLKVWRDEVWDLKIVRYN